MNLIQMQDEALKQMSEHRTSERRADKHRFAVLRQYETQALALGYTAEQVNQQRRDLWDMYKLQRDCEA